MTPLMWAAWKGKTPVVELFISSSAKLDRQEKWGRTALILAADEGHAEVVGDTVHYFDVSGYPRVIRFLTTGSPAPSCRGQCSNPRYVSGFFFGCVVLTCVLQCAWRSTDALGCRIDCCEE
jgi:hypothetical protein